MQSPFLSSGSGGAAVFFSILAGLFGLAVSVVWLWIGWRAMRAHERIADALAQPAPERS
ncbi:MAG: hypothetical protein ABL998_13140 [Planctomycetota bacterium]